MGNLRQETETEKVLATRGGQSRALQVGGGGGGEGETHGMEEKEEID